ncbi:MAG: hypothetical protein BWY65_01118 [Firmicutes bacterium ADurb.Bin373]|mgnify:CR=1 FL=1|nr:hypothetical protein [Bacillota bacterium]OQA09372.1 MAG: hypothetical protein BWY65_01118 [Firmicutes bacterium ADurb.Bin373]
MVIDKYIDENYDWLPADAIKTKEYVIAVEKYENAIGELHGALPKAAQNIIKAFSELTLIELRMAFEQGLRAGIKLCEYE